MLERFNYWCSEAVTAMQMRDLDCRLCVEAQARGDYETAIVFARNAGKELANYRIAITKAEEAL